VVAEQPVTEPAAATVPEPAPVSPIEENWGIQVLGLSLTNNDTAVQVLYTVVSPEKTLQLADTNAAVYLVNQADGTKLPMFTASQWGPAAQGAGARTTRRMMHQAGRFPPAPSRLVAGKTFALEIPNWGRSLQSGSKVSLVVGQLRQDNLTVE
jgi:hypothetical protein